MIVIVMVFCDELVVVLVIVQVLFYFVVDFGQVYLFYEEFVEGYLLMWLGMEWFNDVYCVDLVDLCVLLLCGLLVGMLFVLVVMVSFDLICDQGCVYVVVLIVVGVLIVFCEVVGIVYGFINLCKVILFVMGDVVVLFVVLKVFVIEVQVVG